MSLKVGYTQGHEEKVAQLVYDLGRCPKPPGLFTNCWLIATLRYSLLINLSLFILLLKYMFPNRYQKGRQIKD